MSRRSPSPPVVQLMLVQPPDVERGKAIAAWTREILALPQHIEISVHEFQPCVEHALAIWSVIGVYLKTRDWFFTLVHSPAIISRRNVEAAIMREMADRELQAEIERTNACPPS